MVFGAREQLQTNRGWGETEPDGWVKTSVRQEEEESNPAASVGFV